MEMKARMEPVGNNFIRRLENIAAVQHSTEGFLCTLMMMMLFTHVLSVGMRMRQSVRVIKCMFFGSVDSSSVDF